MMQCDGNVMNKSDLKEFSVFGILSVVQLEHYWNVPIWFLQMILTNEIYLCDIVFEFHWLISLGCIWNIPIPTEICCNVPIEIYWNYKQHNTAFLPYFCCF